MDRQANNRTTLEELTDDQMEGLSDFATEWQSYVRSLTSRSLLPVNFGLYLRIRKTGLCLGKMMEVDYREAKRILK